VNNLVKIYHTEEYLKITNHATNEQIYFGALFQKTGKIVDITAVAILLPRRSKTDFTGKKFICPNPLLSFGSHI